jgi:hypothetical protein
MALFDSEERLVDWNRGFAAEFVDAASGLTPGKSAADIRRACLLPTRALDLSWITGLPFAFQLRQRAAHDRGLPGTQRQQYDSAPSLRRG